MEQTWEKCLTGTHLTFPILLILIRIFERGNALSKHHMPWFDPDCSISIYPDILISWHSNLPLYPSIYIDIQLSLLFWNTDIPIFSSSDIMSHDSDAFCWELKDVPRTVSSKRRLGGAKAALQLTIVDLLCSAFNWRKQHLKPKE